MCLAQGPQRSDAREAWTGGPLVSSQALYHWATALQVLVTLQKKEPIKNGGARGVTTLFIVFSDAQWQLTPK